MKFPILRAALYDAIVPTGTATVDAPIEVRALTVSAGGAVQVDNDLTVTQDAQFTGGAVDVAAGATLTLGGNVLFHGGASYTGDGVISPTGATVSFENGQTNIFVGQFNIGEAAHTIIGQNDAVALNVDQIDDDNTIDGIITINRGGTLNIGQSTRSFWQTSAVSTINFENQAPASSLNQIAGPATVIQGTVNVNGGLVRMRSNTTLRADPNFVPGNGVSRATVNMNPQGILRFDNIANLEDVLITGGGTLRFLQESTAVATISADADIDVDAFETVQNGTVSIHGSEHSRGHGVA